MSYSTRKIKRDAGSVPVPQYFNVGTDDFEVQQGSNGASFVQLTGSNLEKYGKSTDTKPTTNLTVGTSFFEIDTKIVYMWDGASWVVI